VQQSDKHGPIKDDSLAHETDDQPSAEGALTDHRRGTPPGMEPEDVEERSEIARFLDRAAFPGTRADLLASAEGHQATDHVREQLSRLPEGERFENMQEVARALGIGTEEKRT